MFILAIVLFLGQAVAADPLARAVDEAAQRLQVEERRVQLGASTASDVTLHRRELARAKLALAHRDGGAAPLIAMLFDTEAKIAEQQFDEEVRRFRLGASDDAAIAERRRDLLRVRRGAAEWTSRQTSYSAESRATARRQVRALLEEELAVAREQLRNEERKVAAGAGTREPLAGRQAEVAELEANLRALPATR